MLHKYRVRIWPHGPDLTPDYEAEPTIDVVVELTDILGGTSSITALRIAMQNHNIPFGVGIELPKAEITRIVDVN